MDSATLCALAAESVPDLLTFTVGFDREGYSEIDDAMATATALGVKSVPYLIGPEEFLACLPRIIWQLDDPMADAAAIPLWFAAREARKHVKVVLSGEGADELFGGYGVYYQPGVVRAGRALPVRLVAASRRGPLKSPRPWQRPKPPAAGGARETPEAGLCHAPRLLGRARRRVPVLHAVAAAARRCRSGPDLGHYRGRRVRAGGAVRVDLACLRRS